MVVEHPYCLPVGSVRQNPPVSGSDDGLADGAAEPLGEAEGLAAVLGDTVMVDWKAVASCSLVKHSS